MPTNFEPKQLKLKLDIVVKTWKSSAETLLASITTKVHECGKSFIFVQIRGDVYPGMELGVNLILT